MKLLGAWRYPVKSLQGEALDLVDVESDGVSGDRRWGIRDATTGRILTARRRPELLAASATYVDGVPQVELPDGRTARGPGPDTDALLSDWLQSPVSLVSSLEGEAGRAEAFADATDDTSEAVEWTMPEARYVDAAPLLVLTTASLRAGAARYPDGVWDSRRFRPNLLLDVEGEDWVEDAWLDAELRVGAVALGPAERCVRCTMVTRPQPGGLEHDVDIFRTLARHHGGRFGVWCLVLRPGRLQVGDEAEVGERAAAYPG